jgi:hypothetical protein
MIRGSTNEEIKKGYTLLLVPLKGWEFKSKAKSGRTSTQISIA